MRLRLYVTNIVGAALVGAAAHQGWVTTIYQGDSTGLVVLIALLFLLGLGICHARGPHPWVRHIAGYLVLLGLIGTVLGFIIALSGVKDTVDVTTVGPMVARLIEGMSVALYTTLVGAVLNIWLMVNYHLASDHG